MQVLGGNQNSDFMRKAKWHFGRKPKIVKQEMWHLWAIVLLEYFSYSVAENISICVFSFVFQW